MNREILFRAKKVDGGEWVEGYVVQKYGTYFLYDAKNADTCKQNNYFVEPDTICQYIGMNDALENKIYENDIVKCGDYVGTVKHEDGCFLIEWSNAEYIRKDMAYWANERNIRVIGNAFDTPELLKKKSESVIYRDFMKKGRE